MHNDGLFSYIPCHLSLSGLALRIDIAVLLPESPRCLGLPLEAAGGPPDPAAAGDTIGEVGHERLMDRHDAQ